MDSINQGPSIISQNISDLNEDNSIPTKKDLLTSSEHTETEFQDFGYCSQTNEYNLSPPEDSSSQSVHKNSTAFPSQMPKPVQAEIKLPLRAIADRENQEPSKKKPRSSQTSLDMFAYVKRSVTNNEMKQNISSKHTVLQSNFSENFEVNKREGKYEEKEFKEDFTKILKNSLDADSNANKVSLSVTLEKHKVCIFLNCIFFRYIYMIIYIYYKTNLFGNMQF